MAECQCVVVSTEFTAVRAWCPVHGKKIHGLTPPRKEIDPRRSEMRAIIQALERAWSRCPDASLFDLLEAFPTTGDAELLKALEKYGVPK